MPGGMGMRGGMGMGMQGNQGGGGGHRWVSDEASTSPSRSRCSRWRSSWCHGRQGGYGGMGAMGAQQTATRG